MGQLTYPNTTSIQILVIHRVDRRIGLRRCSVRLARSDRTCTQTLETNNEAETPRPTSLAVLHDDTLRSRIVQYKHETRQTQLTSVTLP